MKKERRLGIVLGGGVFQNKLSYDARTRINKALQLLKNNTIQKLILSGKSSTGNTGKTEARLYQEYLLQHGVNKNKLILEENSLDTIGNAIYSKRIIIEKNLPKNVVVITSNYHLKRAIMIFKHIFGKDYIIYGISSYPLLPHVFLRFFKEWEKKEADKIILAEVSIGDHLKAEKILKNVLIKYQNI